MPPPPANASQRDVVCRNCTVRLRGAYCHRCGQRARSRIAPVGTLVREALTETLNLDTRLARTLVRLLFVPGQLTCEYLAARRRRYVSPLRLFVFFSFVLFLVIGLSQGRLMGTESDWERFAQGVADGAAPHAQSDTSAASSQHTNTPANGSLIAVSDDIRESLHAFVEKQTGAPEVSSQVARRAALGLLRTLDNPDRFVERAVGRLSVLAFVMLPLFAGLLKMLYWRTGHLYAEHLIVALHLHAFLFVLLLVATLHNLFSLSILPGGTNGFVRWVLFGYLLLTLRRVYAQSWPWTFMKTAVLLVGYGVLLAVGFALYLGITVAFS
ncbi:MAG: DUF3667 domain-containing protein [Longimonas sp.]|uniref:DUF3667 domain-containing protein n=1 Tax=Longimonas sp. TaxID=2039626 RepID=UPI003357E47E